MTKYINETIVNQPTAVPLINGTVFNWASISLVVGGVILKGFTSITYGSKQQVDNVYAGGGTVYGRSWGNRTYDGCTISILLKDLHALRLEAIALGGKDIMDIPPFDIIVSYQPTTSALVVVDTLKNCSFMEDTISANQNDPALTVTVPFLPADITRK